MRSATETAYTVALNLSLQYKQTQSLVITPRLRQAIKLLQYSHTEMVAHVEEQLLENPTLEAVPHTEHGEGLGDGGLRDKAAADRDDRIEQQNGAETNVDWEKFLQHMSDRGPGLASGSLGGTIHDDLPPIETNLTYGESLADHLLFQLHMMRMHDDEYRAAEAIVHNLDHRGYLGCSLEEIIEETGVDEDLANDALELVQTLDPPGCGARDLGECLIFQARQAYPEDDMFERILGQHLGNLERKNYAAISRDLDLELEDVIEYHKMIQELEPHPGRAFVSEEPRYIEPDLYVQKINDEWIVLLNEEGMPELKISGYYRKILEGASKEDKDYLIEKLKGAEFLIKSIHKRRRTIRRVMESILKFQRDFFDHGVQGLRPLVLQDVADDIDVHMSTVSRATTNKYVHTPHGIVDLKFFFSSGVRQDAGGDMAAEAIKERIRSLVADENPKKPLSDQALAKKLSEDGVRVARRTVAKYREALGILSSSKRKQVF